GDFRAQIAANRLAQERLAELCRRRGRDTVLEAFDEVLAYAERRTREAIRALPDGSYRAESEIEGDGVSDDDIPIRITVTVAGDRMTIDFAGTAGGGAGSVNCPLAVTRSACYFALRVLLPDDVPANAGTYAPLRIEAPEGSRALLPSPAPAAPGSCGPRTDVAHTR